MWHELFVDREEVARSITTSSLCGVFRTTILGLWVHEWQHAGLLERIVGQLRGLAQLEIYGYDGGQKNTDWMNLLSLIGALPFLSLATAGV